MAMKAYVCHKTVRAMQIAEIHPGRADKRGPGSTLRSAAGDEASVSEKWMYKHTPMAGGYYVIYEDGYESYSPAYAFESGYSLS
jgi:hypothetical protein